MLCLFLLLLVDIPRKHNNRDHLSNIQEMQSLAMRLRSKWPVDFDCNSAIDVPIIWINLEKSIGRRRYMTQEFSKLGLSPAPSRVEAVDGAKYLLQPWSEPWIHPRLHHLHMELLKGQKLSAAELGCTLSHLKALDCAHRLGVSATLILEDDVDFSCTGLWPQSLSQLVGRAPVDWNFIQLHRASDECLLEKTSEYAKPLQPLLQKEEGKTCFLTTAYLVSRRAIQGIQDLFFEEGILSEKYYWYCMSHELDFRADHLIYNILAPNNVYLEELSRFTANNTTEELDSTIHPDHTPGHIESTLKRWRQYL